MIGAILHSVLKQGTRGQIPRRSPAPAAEEEEVMTEAKFKVVMAKVPREEECVMSGPMLMQRSCAAISKDQRKMFGAAKTMPVEAYLTKDMLVLGKQHAKTQLDQIPLKDINSVALAADQCIRKKDIGGAGTLVLKAQQRSDSTIHLEARGQTLANKDGIFGLSDPFFRVLLQKEDRSQKEIYVSEVIQVSLVRVSMECTMATMEVDREGRRESRQIERQSVADRQRHGERARFFLHATLTTCMLCLTPEQSESVVEWRAHRTRRQNL